MTKTLTDELDDIERDGQITPDEHDRVFNVFRMARAIANERDEYRSRLEQKHDEQFVKTAAVLIGAVSTSLVGYLTSQGATFTTILIALLTIGGSFIMALGFAYVKRYIPNAIQAVKAVAKITQNPAAITITNALDAATTPAPAPPAEAPEEAPPDATQPETPGDN